MAGTIDFGLLGVGEPSGYEQARQRDVQGQLQNQQLESGRFTLEKMKQDRDALAKMQEVMAQNGQTGDLETNFKAMINSGIPQVMEAGIKGLQKLQEQKQFETLMGGMFPTGEAAAPSAAPAGMPAQNRASAAPVNAMAARYPDANTNSVMFNNLAPSYVAANNAPSVNALPAAVSSQPVAAASNNVMADLNRKIAGALSLAAGGNQGAKVLAESLIKQRDALIAEENKSQVVSPGSTVYKGGVAVYTAPATPEKPVKPLQELNAFKELSPADQKTFMAMKRAEQAPAQPSAPVKVLDPVTGKEIYVTREEAVSKKMSPVSERVELAPKEIQKREAAYPTATSAVKGFETKSNSFINDLKALRDSPGLDEITGFVAGRIAGITAAGRKAQALYEKIVAKGGFQALQDLRDASKTGGALGNVSNQEGKQLAASFAAIDRRQSADDVRAALDQAIADVEGSRTRIREAYDSTYDYRNANQPAAATAPAAGKSSAGKSSAIRSEADKILGR